MGFISAIQSLQNESRYPQRWRPGQSGNPSGKPHQQSIGTLLRAMLAEGRAIELCEELFRLALHAKQETVRLAAIQHIADRSEGKCVQAIHIEQTVNPESARTLAELAVRMVPYIADSIQASGPNRPLIGTGE